MSLKPALVQPVTKETIQPARSAFPEGKAGRTLTMGVEEQRAKSLDDIPNLPTVRLTMDMEIFSSLGCGRIQLDEVQAENGVRIEGDRPLGPKILEEMNIMV